MTVKYVVLAEEIVDEIDKLEKVEGKIKTALSKAQKSRDEKEFYLDSIAINLYLYYTGVENIFHSIAAKIDGEIPSGDKWHADLLIQMSTELKDIRPAIISDETRENLRELLAFRHLIRNIYSFYIDEKQIIKICNKLASFSKILYSELDRFTKFLRPTGENS